VDAVAPKAPLLPHDRRVYLDARLWQDWSSVRYLCPAGPDLVPMFDGAELGMSPGSEVLLALWPFEDHGPALELLPSNSLIRVREGAHERGDLETESRLLYVLYEAGPPGAWIEEQPLAVWEQGINLLDFKLERLPENALRITLYWQATEPVDGDYTAFRHVWSPDAQIGQLDGPPALGYYSTNRWRPGDLVEDVRIVALDQDVQPGRLCVQVGLYRWETMDRLIMEVGGVNAERTYIELCE
jgi:hypothetical protein